jgi:hypothetical protein
VKSQTDHQEGAGIVHWTKKEESSMKRQIIEGSPSRSGQKEGTKLEVGGRCLWEVQKRLLWLFKIFNRK